MKKSLADIPKKILGFEKVAGDIFEEIIEGISEKHSEQDFQKESLNQFLKNPCGNFRKCY